MTRIRCDRTPAWSALRTLQTTRAAAFDLRQQFSRDPGRFDAFSQSAPHLFADLSKNLIDAEIEQQLFALARQCGVVEHRDAMFGGEAINTTEQRAVKHFLLRSPLPGGAGADPDLRAVHATLDAMLQYAERVRADGALTDVVNIGIGGSDLGPQMAVLALDAFATMGKRLHFAVNPRKVIIWLNASRWCRGCPSHTPAAYVCRAGCWPRSQSNPRRRDCPRSPC